MPLRRLPKKFELPGTPLHSTRLAEPYAQRIPTSRFDGLNLVQIRRTSVKRQEPSGMRHDHLVIVIFVIERK